MPVAKLLLTVDGDKIAYSIKNTPEHPKRHKKLELLGGNFKGKGLKKAKMGLVNELRVEETTGFLAHRVELLGKSPLELNIDGEDHYIFELDITQSVFKKLSMSGSNESLGFRLVPRDLQFTRKTFKIFSKLPAQLHVDFHLNDS